MFAAGQVRVEGSFLQGGTDQLAHLRPWLATSSPATRADPAVGGSRVVSM